MSIEGRSWSNIGVVERRDKVRWINIRKIVDSVDRGHWSNVGRIARRHWSDMKRIVERRGETIDHVHIRTLTVLNFESVVKVS